MRYKVGQCVVVEDFFSGVRINVKITFVSPELYSGVDIDSYGTDPLYEFEEDEIVEVIRCSKLDLI